MTTYQTTQLNMPEDVTLTITAVGTPEFADTISSYIKFIRQHLEISRIFLRAI
jgi:hypothetical protein